MVTGVETQIVTALGNAFGWGENPIVLGLVALLVTSLLFVIVRPPGIVSALAVGLVVLLLFGNFAGGLGIGMTLVVGVAIIAGLTLYFIMKRPVRDF